MKTSDNGLPGGKSQAHWQMLSHYINNHSTSNGDCQLILLTMQYESRVQTGCLPGIVMLFSNGQTLQCTCIKYAIGSYWQESTTGSMISFSWLLEGMMG